MKNPGPVGDSACRALEEAIEGKDIDDALGEIIFAFKKLQQIL